MFRIGCHISSAGGYLAMAKRAEALGANTFAFFTRNPRGGSAKPIEEADIAAFHAECARAGIDRLVAHAPYTLNPCAAKANVAEFARIFGVLGGLNLDERSRAQLGEATGHFSLAYPCGAHHNDIAGSDLVAQFRRKALAAPTVPNRYGNHTLRLILTDDVFVQFRDDFAGRQFTHVRSSLKKCRPKHLEGPPVPQNSYNRATALQTF